MLVPAWWPFDFRLPVEQKPYFESFELVEVRYRSQFEKDVLKLALFIPIGILLAVILNAGMAKPKAVACSVMIGGLISILIQGGRYFLPGNTPNLNDVLINSTGTLLGGLVIYFSDLSRRTLAGLIAVAADVLWWQPRGPVIFRFVLRRWPRFRNGLNGLPSVENSLLVLCGSGR